MNTLFAAILLKCTLLQFSAANQQCGRLQKEQVYDETNVAQLNEFPWFGQIYFSNYGRELTYRCNGVLITKRDLVAPAHCFIGETRYRPAIVVVGDANYGNAMYEQDCDTRGRCAPVPKQYEISRVAVHPNFDRRQRINDIAVVNVKVDIEFSEYIQPICMPSIAVHTADLLTHYFIFAGFSKQNEVNNHTEKMKTVAHILPLKDCEAILNSQVPSTNLCASSLGMFEFLSGSALMGINVENTSLTSYYLIGLLSYGTNPSTRMLDVFNRVPSFANWILSNVVEKNAHIL